MTRSRVRKLQRSRATTRSGLARNAVPLASAISAILVSAASVRAQEAPALEEIVVTAQKRTENLQDVPLSIQAFGTQKLEELHVTNVNDYVALLPSVSMQAGNGQGDSGGPGLARVYMRGVSTGGDGNHSGSLPSVGTYLDEQPITTIDGALDVHVYDIERVEALAGPQGTLYGASSEAGTIRIITNKPDPSGFKAGYDVGVNSVGRGGIGYEAEGFVNLPLSPIAAIRLVGWHEHDAGYIDNVAGTSRLTGVTDVNGNNVPTSIVGGVRTYPTSGVSINNAAFRKKDYNDVNTSGGRAALKLDLGESWTITPMIIGQHRKSNGFFGSDTTIGDFEVTHFSPEYKEDNWVQSALTVEGKISNFDIVYSGGYMKRTEHSQSDYSDYSFFYDTVLGSGQYVVDNNNNPINPTQTILGRDLYTKVSHELRVSTPKDYPLRFVGGAFLQRQVHDIFQRYEIPGLADSLQVPGWPDTLWLTQEQRVDRDSAVFGELTYDVTDKLAATAGVRHYHFDNSLFGFFGFGGFSTHTGVSQCFSPAKFQGAPCTNLNTDISDSGNTPRFNLSYKFDPDHMVYLTYSKGFRPGGVNRRNQLASATPGAPPIPVGPYKADFLKNYELGWKTSGFDHRLRFNGAIFLDDWDDLQYSFLGPNSLTIIANAGKARIKGIESDIDWAATSKLTLSAGAAFIDAKLRTNYCGVFGENGSIETSCAVPRAPAGTQLPVTPRFKGNITARYSFNVGSFDGDVQGTFAYQSYTWSDLRLDERKILGQQPAYGLLNLSSGLRRDGLSFELILSNALDRKAQLQRFAECPAAPPSTPTEKLCGGETYVIYAQPRTIGLKIGQKF